MKIGRRVLQKALVIGISDLPDQKMLLCGKFLIVLF